MGEVGKEGCAEMKLYLAGPMRGLPNHNFPAFHAATTDLRKRGHHVVSPAEHDEECGFDPSTDEVDRFYLAAQMRWDLAAVLESEGVVVLPGWLSSEGTSYEVGIANVVHIPVFEYPSLELVKPELVTAEAARIVTGARQSSYGHPAEDFSRTGRIWGAILDHWRRSELQDVPPELVGLCMVGVKISREVNGHKRDNLVDGAGYFETVNLIHDRT